MTGVLPICLYESKKVIEFLHMLGKEYVGIAEFHKEISLSKLKDTVREFVGEIYQRPPLRSSVARRLRRRIIYYLQLLEFDGRHLLFRVGCESGTYIRKLVHDWGLVSGVGAHMAELRRTRDGVMTEEDSVSLYEVAAAFYQLKKEGDDSLLRQVVKPVENVLTPFSSIYVKDSAVDAICHGAQLSVRGISKLETPIIPGQPVLLKTLKGELIALGKAVQGHGWMLKADSGIAVHLLRVVMPTGYYPKLWKSHK